MANFSYLSEPIDGYIVWRSRGPIASKLFGFSLCICQATGIELAQVPTVLIAKLLAPFFVREAAGGSSQDE